MTRVWSVCTPGAFVVAVNLMSSMSTVVKQLVKLRRTYVSQATSCQMASGGVPGGDLMTSPTSRYLPVSSRPIAAYGAVSVTVEGDEYDVCRQVDQSLSPWHALSPTDVRSSGCVGCLLESYAWSRYLAASLLIVIGVERGSIKRSDKQTGASRRWTSTQRLPTSSIIRIMNERINL